MRLLKNQKSLNDLLMPIAFNSAILLFFDHDDLPWMSHSVCGHLGCLKFFRGCDSYPLGLLKIVQATWKAGNRTSPNLIIILHKIKKPEIKNHPCCALGKPSLI